MVQFRKFRAVKPYDDVWKHPNDYWKLDSGGDRILEELRDFLATKKFSCKNTRALNRFLQLYVRYQRGLPSYEGLLAPELEHFLLQRGLTPASGKNTKAYQLKTQLEKADEDATFDRFSDLPPELRQTVYEMYFASFENSSLPISCQPPITLASRMTRVESLPLFYSRCEFALGFQLNFVDFLPSSYIDHNGCFFRQTKQFLQTNSQNVSRIKYFQIHFKEFDLSSPRYSITFDLSDDVHPDKMFRFDKDYFNGVDDQAAIAEVRLWAESVAARKGPMKLLWTDVTDLQDILRAAF